MSSIGPQLPPQPPSKRKRTPEAGDASPSFSKHARRNNHEIDLDGSDSDSDSYGPRAAPALTAPSSRPSLGPSLPPSTAGAQNQHEIGLDSSPSSPSDTDTRPAPPPPPPPPPPAPTRTATEPDSDSDSDEYGPALPSASSSSSSRRRAPIGPSLPPPSAAAAPARDSWMLAPPPPSSGYAERDPTRLKARKFTSKPTTTASSSSSSDLAAVWTETPEEKLKRLQDSVLGRTSDGGGSAAADEARSREGRARDDKISASIAASRGRSLYEEHRGGRAGARAAKEEDDDDDPSKRAFDREKDMALGSKIGSAQRRELVAKSANFGGRFQKGSFL